MEKRIKKKKTIFDEIQKKYQDIFINLLIKSHKLGNWRIKQNEKSYKSGFCQKIYDWNHQKKHHLKYNLGYYGLAYDANKKEERKQKFVSDIEAILEKCLEFLHKLIRKE